MQKIAPRVIVPLVLLIVVVGTLFFLRHSVNTQDTRTNIVNTKFGYQVTPPQGWHLWRDVSAASYASNKIVALHKDDFNPEDAEQLKQFWSKYAQEFADYYTSWNEAESDTLVFTKRSNLPNYVNDPAGALKTIQELTASPDDTVVKFDATSLEVTYTDRVGKVSETKSVIVNGNKVQWKSLQLNGSTLQIVELPLHVAGATLDGETARSLSIGLQSADPDILTQFLNGVIVSL
jgi:hypothetical protein